MNRREFAIITRALEKIDAGGDPPRLSGAPGAFFRRYAAARGSAVELALAAEVYIRRDGRLSGAPLGEVSLTPLLPQVTSSLATTPWGDVGRFVGLCPDLLSVVVVRTWLQGASGREGLRVLQSLSESQSACIIGAFLWSPPGVITTGRADFEVAQADSTTHWTTAPYLKATADDLSSPPHPLDFRDIQLAGRPLLAQFRCTIVVPTDTPQMRLVGGASEDLATIRLRNSRAISTEDRERLMLCDAPIFVLLYREPWDTEWTVLSTAEATAVGAFEHVIKWGAFLRGLDDQYAPGVDLVARANRAVEALGLEAPGYEAAGPIAFRTDEPESRLAVMLARAIRVHTFRQGATLPRHSSDGEEGL